MNLKAEIIQIGKFIIQELAAQYPNIDETAVLEEFDIKEVELKELLIYLLKEGHWFFYTYLIGFRNDVIRLNYQDFLEILTYFADYRRNSTMMFLENYLESVYNFIGIDLIQDYAKISVINKRRQQLTLQYYYERPGVLCREEEKWALERLGLDFEIFKPLQSKLESQGAKKAAIINPEPHTEISGSVKLFSVQGNPPNSWSWITEVEKNWIKEE